MGYFDDFGISSLLHLRHSKIVWVLVLRSSISRGGQVVSAVPVIDSADQLAVFEVERRECAYFCSKKPWLVYRIDHCAVSVSKDEQGIGCIVGFEGYGGGYGGETGGATPNGGHLPLNYNFLSRDGSSMTSTDTSTMNGSKTSTRAVVGRFENTFSSHGGRASKGTVDIRHGPNDFPLGGITVDVTTQRDMDEESLPTQGEGGVSESLDYVI